VSPAWVYIRLTLLKDFPFKDVKQGWQVFVIFKTTSVIVVHRKQEQSQDNFFSFCWELVIVFDKATMNFQQAKFSIIQINYEEQMEKSEKEKLEKIVTGWKQETILPERPIQTAEDKDGFHSLKGHQDDIALLKDEIFQMKKELKEKKRGHCFFGK